MNLSPAKASIIGYDTVLKPIIEAFRPKASIIGLGPSFKPITEASGPKASIIVFRA